ncbi:pyridoxamine 5'-phosphate oxidase [Lactobacillus delbrueckii subsp. bulgaricus]|nr:pyridoxamine 5'-phosphate oxidase [Lactobacillus delbrueckii subsp. bulgaricus]MBT8849784.1 pyridoxamine 5'-phosphate oxidase [Lactobacillus delbrueckii subsp. bulgaricus]MBT8851250.1 pyridoxamine 5'-phosphate oxidase [Lactobacillus delbrueckii subsp. bulgaricus]MBT8852646.1 pyridoxamine 5'-phosphate oxidase [Lactobacillus delbrueckii subsp. bulgaricus]MBT8854303.1 pyridoxamine 5'-phosphate oxidase [Lactobacillus delbrueckii subsp. bulgaricus]
MKKLEATTLTADQQKFFNDALAFVASVDKDGNPQVGPKGSLTALDDKHLVWSEVTSSHLWENIKNGSKVAVVVADVPSHTSVRVVGSVTIHEGDDFAKEYAAKVGKPETAPAVVVEVEEIFA